MTEKQRRDFWKKVDQNLGDSGCWPWIAGKDQNKYGVSRFTAKGQNKSKITKAHRVSWILTYGEIPSDQVVRHKCDNPTCVNPNHLELGTQKDNMDDRNIRGNARWKGYTPSKIGDTIISLGPKEMSLASYWNNFSIETREELEDKLGIPASYKVVLKKKKG